MQSLDEFDSSVWAAPSPVSHQDDFDDFHTPLGSQTPSIVQDDDFADFGDFGDVDANFAFEEGPPLGWRPLRLDPPLSLRHLSLQVDEILGPVWPNELPKLTRDEDIRQVEGIAQILATSTGRELYLTLLNSPPLMEPVSWVRSRIRQQHMIALGLPVNLDEILPQTPAKSLPPLRMSARPTSVGANGQIRSVPPSRSSSQAGTRSATPSARSGPSTVMQLSLGPRPELDAKKINDLLRLDIDQLNLFPLSKLDKYLAELRQETTNTSSLLTHLLQTRDALQQDSETYNRLIAELVSEAQKNKTGKSFKAGLKRSGTYT